MLRILLALALLHLSVAPAWAAAPPRRWPSRLVNSLELARTFRPGRSLPTKAWLRDGTVVVGGLLSVEQEADSLYAPRLAAWIAADPDRAVLPPLGQELRLARRYQAGRQIHGVFLGFNGPCLLLQRDGQESPASLPFAGVGLVSAAGSLRLDSRALDATGAWPPSRQILVVQAATGVQRLRLDDLSDLQLSRQMGVEGYVVGSVLVIVIVTLVGFYLLLSRLDWPETDVT